MIGFSIFCLLIDYGVYFAADVLYARRQLAVSKQTATDQNAVWRRLCGMLLAVAVPIHLAHHRPLLLYFLIFITFLLTLRRPFEQYWSQLTDRCPILVTLAGAVHRNIAALSDLAATRFYQFLLSLSGSRKQDRLMGGKKPQASSNHSNYSSAFDRFVPSAAPKPPTSSLLSGNDTISNQYGVSHRSVPSSTQHQIKSLLGDRRLHNNDYCSEQESPFLRGYQPLGKCLDYSQPQAVEEEDSLLTNGSLLHPPRRSFLKTSTPVDAAAGAKGSSCRSRP
uniref:Uncharacterized protein n=1 Tax=Plectus sambesii TaxID=2011161 RepID=A0A914WV23_9BILA